MQPRVATLFGADLGCRRQSSADEDEVLIDDDEADATRASSPARSLCSPTFSLGGDLESPTPASEQRDAAASVRFSDGAELSSSFRKVLRARMCGGCVHVREWPSGSPNQNLSLLP